MRSTTSSMGAPSTLTPVQTSISTSFDQILIGASDATRPLSSMESPQLDLWERFDFDPSCLDSALDFDMGSKVGHSFEGETYGLELEDISKDSKDGMNGEPCPEPKQDIQTNLPETQCQGLEPLTHVYGVPVATFFDDDLSCVLSNEDFNIPGCDLFADASFPCVDTMKSDCMWSSTLRNAAESPGRRRNFSLSLGECRDGLVSPRDVECLSNGPSGFLIGTCPLLDAPPATSGDDSAALVYDQKPTMEVIDQYFEPKPEPNTTIVGHQTYLDHSYFSVRPPSNPIEGLLVPTESVTNESGALMPGNIDKRKLAHAVQSLMKRNYTNPIGEKLGSVESVKFKFRMKFKSDSVVSINCKGRAVEKKRAILKATPSPVVYKSNSFRPPRPTPMPKFQQSLLVRNNNNLSPKSSSCHTSPIQEQKVREIRDLHNSMERQRRIDLRKKFDKLKSVVPELAEIEKTSKLNILSKAAIYCSQLNHTDAKLKKEADREAAKNQQLQKKLQAFQNLFNNGARRFSMVNK